MYFSQFFTLVCLLSVTNCDERGSRVKRIVGGSPADVPPVDDPAVYTNFAGRAAKVEGVREFPHYVFKGIKFAHPPMGKDRFLRPRQKFLEGVVNATVYAPPCVQPVPGTNMVIGSEDCLALNVFTPELPTGTEGLPVVVWIHGGGFRYGSASQYGVRHLVGKQLVVVTIQYRLGSLGFLSSGNKVLPGNVALWDMVLAVQWIRNYIGFFGGNPYRIVVMGHGTGASSALMFALSKVAKGLAAGIIAMSGTAVSNWAVDHTPKNTANDIATQNGCPTTNSVTMVKCLQNLPADSVIMGDSTVEFHRLHSRGFMSGLSGGLGSAPVTEGYNDGRSLPGLVENEPMNDLTKENNPKIPLLTGICRDETRTAVRGHLREDIVHKVETIPNFLENVLVKNLRGLISLNLNLNLSILDGNLEKTLNKLLPLNFGNYLRVKKGNIFQILDTVADVTGDALFNVPAFLTVDKWSKNGAPTFLYSFEHLGKRKKGNVFLRGSPLIGNDTNSQEYNDTVGHGDDLAYLFDVNDINGDSIKSDENSSEDDTTVRDIFTQMISDFARNGVPRINNQNIQPFSGKTNNFIQIKAQPVLANNFKFCEMALWLNLAERLKSTSCAFLNALDGSLKNIGNIVTNVLNNTQAGDVINRLKDQKGLGFLDGGNNQNGGVLNVLESGGNKNGGVLKVLTGSAHETKISTFLDTGANQERGSAPIFGNSIIKNEGRAASIDNGSPGVSGGGANANQGVGNIFVNKPNANGDWLHGGNINNLDPVTRQNQGTNENSFSVNVPRGDNNENTGGFGILRGGNGLGGVGSLGGSSRSNQGILGGTSEIRKPFELGLTGGFNRNSASQNMPGRSTNWNQGRTNLFGGRISNSNQVSRGILGRIGRK